MKYYIFFWLKSVSIPHRYGKNTDFRIQDSHIRYSFPFLIGTVRTHYAHNNRNVTGQFPFLIGTVRTKNRKNWTEKDGEMFPFLIGTVRTILTQKNISCQYLFPFLIGTVRTLLILLLKHNSKKFPFLIGTVRTKIWRSVTYWLSEGFHSS